VRRKGIGQALMNFSLDRLREEGIPRCNIFVYSSNDLGNRFWLRSGWIDPTTWKVFQKRLFNESSSS